jgi:hypothetical protein
MEDSDNVTLIAGQRPTLRFRYNNFHRRHPVVCAIVLTLTIIGTSLFGLVFSGARSLSSSDFVPSKINFEDKGRSLMINVEGVFQGGSWTAGAKITSGS